ncbi:MAG: hypothetical protein HOQ43_11535 [Glycomyces artemisiae]|uniref:DUF5666 domain-containing protein n=1 Tax=Glycomyces artemisiae TaxID=1076443 RepID=A0A850C811_9ACTN|nr:hypothetical protein [Glycomyces artemisiae]
MNPAEQSSTATIEDIPPMADDLDEALAARRKRPRTNRATKWLAAGVLVVAGLAGGIVLQQQFGIVDDGAETASDTGGMPDFSAMGGEFPGGMGDMGGFGGQATTGTVVEVGDGTVTIETEDGTTYTVVVEDGTVLTAETAASLADLAAGDTVEVTGSTEDGTITADSVTEQTAE